MDFLKNVIINEIFRQPSILLGLIALFGLVLQKKSTNDVIKGTMLTAIGVSVLTFGTNTIVSSILPIQGAIATLSATSDSATKIVKVDILASYGGAVGTAMLLAFLINVLVARFTKIKHIFLTGHMLFWFPYIFVAVAVEAKFNMMGIIVFATLASAFYFIIMPALLTPFVVKVTGDKTFTLGHPAGFLALIAAIVAKFTGDTKTSTEDLKLPSSLGFLREIAITGSIVMFIVYIVVGIIFGTKTVTGAVDMSLVSFALTQSFTFGAGLTIMLAGVRTIIQNILPAFKGISDKVVPDAIPALDAPMIFSYKPNAVIIGFLVAMVVSTFSIILINKYGNLGFLLLPLVITSFFECGTAAVLAEGQGGLKGAIIGTSVAAIVMSFLLAISVGVFSTTISDWIMIFGGNDFSLFGYLSSLVLKFF